MRVIECNICGETINAENDEELKARLGDHLGSVHDRGTSPEELDELVSSEAYEAMDS
jgi:histidinol phosphatase-like PHP family hydrolase